MRCLEGGDRSILEIKSFFLYTVLEWNVSFKSLPYSSLLDLLEHCNLRD